MSKFLLQLSCVIFVLAFEVNGETWSLDGLATHFMGANSGLPGGQWPPGSQFNSSIAFAVSSSTSPALAPTVIAECSANWAPPAVPVDWASCEGTSSLQWRFVPEQYDNEAKFGLEFLALDTDDASFTFPSNVTVLSASLLVSSNRPSEPTSYLTCIAGAPLTGITCSGSGPLSSLRGPIPLPVTRTIVSPPTTTLTSLSLRPLPPPPPAACIGTMKLALATDANPGSSPLKTATTMSCGVTWLCNADGPPSRTLFLCDDADAQFQVEVPDNRRIDEGFSLEVRRTVEVEGSGKSVQVEVRSGMELRRGTELVVARKGCVGKCDVVLSGAVVLSMKGVKVL